MKMKDIPSLVLTGNRREGSLFGFPRGMAMDKSCPGKGVCTFLE